MGYIYKITNKLNGKVYVGKTDNTPEDRWQQHIYNLHRYQKAGVYNYPLYKALDKYGVENFYLEVIEQCDNTSEREIYWIEEFNTYYGIGYNASKGGEGINAPEAQKLALSKPVYCPELNIETPSVIDMARLLVSMGYVRSNFDAVHAAEVGINRVLKGYNKAYRKLTFQYKGE
jgi:hypothetical protein